MNSFYGYKTLTSAELFLQNNRNTPLEQNSKSLRASRPQRKQRCMTDKGHSPGQPPHLPKGWFACEINMPPPQLKNKLPSKYFPQCVMRQ